jgi:uncharacterized protein (TIGR00661 family)
MKILFAIQGTGNGHISRAREIVPLLQQYGQVDLLVSGTQADVSLEQQLNYRFHGFSFVFGKNGGVDHWQTYKIMNLRRLWSDMQSLKLKEYDLIINDFEPVSAWACKHQHVESVSLSHQCSFLSSNTPRPEKWNYSELIFKHYAPTTYHIGFHFEKYDHFINTPVIRSEIRELDVKNLGHYTVYLPAYDDKLLVKHLLELKMVNWQVFSKHIKKPYDIENVNIRPIENKTFNISLANSAGLLTGGGFEGPAEGLYLRKKVLMIPMLGQYEQQCNALSAMRLGVPVIQQIDRTFNSTIKNWLNQEQHISVNFPNDTAAIIDRLITTYKKT